MRLRKLIEHLQLFERKEGPDITVSLLVENEERQMEDVVTDVALCPTGKHKRVVIMSEYEED